MNTILDAIPRPELEKFCRRWQITELALFGSVLRDDFRPDSDIDTVYRIRQLNPGQTESRSPPGPPAR